MGNYPPRQGHGQHPLIRTPCGTALADQVCCAAAILDGLFQPMADLLVARPETVTQLLDIGCGTGASLLASAAARPSALHRPWTSPRRCWLARQRAEAAGLDADFTSPTHSSIRCPPRTSTGSNLGWA